MIDAIFSWNTLWWVLLVIYVPSCIGLILLVLLQQGKGTGFAGAFGAGAGPGSDTVFGPKGAQTMPVKMTYVGASIFMVVAIVMSLLAGRLGTGDAPELIEGAADAPSSASGQMADYGIGTSVVDTERADSTEIPEVVTSVVEAEPEATVEATSEEGVVEDATAEETSE